MRCSRLNGARTKTVQFGPDVHEHQFCPRCMPMYMDKIIQQFSYLWLTNTDDCVKVQYIYRYGTTLYQSSLIGMYLMNEHMVKTI